MPGLRMAALAILFLLPLSMPSAAGAEGSLSEEAPASPSQSDPFAAVEEAVVEALRRAMSLLATTLDAAIPYELPEVLPNGDIILRRKPPGEDPPEVGTEEDGTIRL